MTVLGEVRLRGPAWRGQINKGGAEVNPDNQPGLVANCFMGDHNGQPGRAKACAGRRDDDWGRNGVTCELGQWAAICGSDSRDWRRRHHWQREDPRGVAVETGGAWVRGWLPDAGTR